MTNSMPSGSQQVDTIAAAIHETWRALAREEGWSMQPHLDLPFSELAPPDQEDNRAAARRIPLVLALAGLEARPDSPVEPPVVTQTEFATILDRHLEAMAEAEHDGWMSHRAVSGWRHGEPRDDARKVHPAVVPYAQLPEREKQKDRNNVRHYPDFLARAGLRIVKRL